MSDGLSRPPGPGEAADNLRSMALLYWRMQRDTLGTIGDRFDRWGDTYFTMSRGDALYVTRHPDLTRQVLVEDAASYEKRNDLQEVLGRGVLEANGEDWRRQRRRLQPAFTRARLESYGDTMVRLTEEWVSSVTEGASIDITDAMMRLTLNIVGRVLFGENVDDKVEVVGRAMEVMQDAFTKVSIIPRSISPLHKRKDRALAQMNALVFELVAARQAQPDPGDDLLGTLVRGLSDDPTLDKQLVRDELVTLFLAGHETTSLALSWTLELLGRHPEVRDEVVAEVAALGSRPATWSDLDSLPKTGRALDEAMRLYPPAYAVPRKAKADTKLGDFDVPAGTEVVMWIYHQQRDERWFPRATEFWPDRFVDSQGVLHSHAYMPFGAGQRLCIGRHFARAEALLVLATALRHGIFEPAGPPARAKPRVTLAPKGSLTMTLKRHDLTPAAI